MTDADQRPAGPVRLAILDDNPFVRDADGTVRPAAALFHRFAEAVVTEGGLAPATYLVPVRDGPGDAGPAAALRGVDPTRLQVVPTAPFGGIAGYLQGSPSLVRRNWPVIRDAVAAVDLLWIKAPASNAPLAALAARRAGIPRFTWVAGSVRDVARGARRNPAARIAGGAVGILYDGTTRILERTGPSIRLGPELFTSVVTAAEIDATLALADGDHPTAAPGSEPLRLAWAGRMAGEKGLEDLIAATATLVAAGRDVRLGLIGDGPTRTTVAAAAAAVGINGRVTWHGYVTDRDAYMALLRAAAVFVLPSHAEGVPKVLVEAMAAGLPVVATRAGNVPAVLGEGDRGVLVPIGDPAGLADALGRLADDVERRARLADAGLAFAREHTVEAQASRLLRWLATTFPELPWSAR